MKITLAFVSLYGILGWPAFIGVAIMIISIPMNTVIARWLKGMQEKQMKNRDQRTRLMSELLANIRSYVTVPCCNINDRVNIILLVDGCSIKLYAWENAFIRKILAVRNNQELKMLKKIGVVTVCILNYDSMIPF